MNKLLVSASVALGATSLSFAQQTEKPNFLLFIADDCSHYDLGCYGSVDSKTPNIDHFHVLLCVLNDYRMGTLWNQMY